jgi:hypothetical protein
MLQENFRIFSRGMAWLRASAEKYNPRSFLHLGEKPCLFRPNSVPWWLTYFSSPALGELLAVLTFFDCDRRLRRRDFLRVGALGLGGLSLPALLAARSQGASSNRVVTDKSVIFLFMHGGPSQIETFDPKMGAPQEIRSVTGEIATQLPGITFGSTFPKLAQRNQRFSIVRSFQTGDGNHDIKPIVGKHSLKANLGALYARVAGPTHPATGMPTNAVLAPPAVDDTTRPTTMNFGRFDATGTLGAACTPFMPGAGGDLQQDMQLALPRQRLDDRRHLLERLDRIRREADSGGLLAGMDRFQEQAFRTILGGVAGAFDLSKEDPRVVARYDTSGLLNPEQIDRRLNNYNNYVDHGKSLGKLLLLARRLCESGCGFVTVTTNFVWDNHADVNNAGVEEGMKYCGLPFDHAVSALLDDLESRGLSDKILLVCCGEMGRTPRINKKGGRDHWGSLAPLMLAGGGLEMGKVIGQSNSDAGEPRTEPVTIDHLIATIMHTLLDVGQLRLERGVPEDVARLITGGEPIAGLL